MNAARRERQKAHRAQAGKHTVADHTQGERCQACRPSPGGMGGLLGVRDEAWRASAVPLAKTLFGGKK